MISRDKNMIYVYGAPDHSAATVTRAKNIFYVFVMHAISGAPKTLSKDIYFAVAPDRHGWVHHKGRLKRPLAECPISSSD